MFPLNFIWRGKIVGQISRRKIDWAPDKSLVQKMSSDWLIKAGNQISERRHIWVNNERFPNTMSKQLKLITSWCPQRSNVLLQNLRKRDDLNSAKYFTPKNKCADVYKAQFSNLNLNFTLKTVLLSNAILSFFSWRGLYFHPSKDCCSKTPSSTSFDICSNFGQIFCTKVIHFFCGKYGT